MAKDLVGPGPRKDLVQEAALTALLDLAVDLPAVRPTPANHCKGTRLEEGESV